MKDKDQDINFPDLGHKRQHQRNSGTDQVKAHQYCAAWQTLCQRSRDRRDADIGQHFDGQRRAEDDACLGTRQVKCQQTQRDRGQAGSQQGDDLREKQVAVRSVGENFKHGSRRRRSFWKTW